MTDNKLTETEKVDMLKYNISRYDHYFASVNFKSSFLVLGNITILGFVLSNRTHIHDYIFYVLVLLIASSLITVLLAIKPYLKRYEGKASVVFFNDIANISMDSYRKNMSKLLQSDYRKDLEEQVYILAKGLTRKFLYLNIATITFICTIAIFFIYMGFFMDTVGGVK
jgi:hypothetical protein